MPLYRSQIASIPRGLRAKQILIIDDDKGIRRLITDTLAPLGYEILGADLAEEGVSVLDDIVVDLAIIDIFMAGAGGIWGIQEVRARQPTTKILAVSGGWGKMPAHPVVEAARRIGADRTLMKPFRLAELEAAVTEMIGGPLEVSVLPATDGRTRASGEVAPPPSPLRR